MRAALYSFLASLGTGIGNRWYPGRTPSGVALPAGTFQQTGNVGAPSQANPAFGGYRATRFQLAIIASTDTSLDAEVRRTMAGLDGARGIWAGVPIHGVHIDNDFDAAEPDDSSLRRHVIEITIEHTAPAAPAI